MPKIEPPAIWYDLGQSVHQDFHLDHPDITSGLVEMTTERSPEAVELLRTFIRRILAEETDAGLRLYWAQAGPMFYFSGNGTRLMLTDLLKCLDDPSFTCRDVLGIGLGRIRDWKPRQTR